MSDEIFVVIMTVILAGGGAWAYTIISEDMEDEKIEVKTMNCTMLNQYLIDRIDINGRWFIDGNYKLAQELYDLKHCDKLVMVNGSENL